ncbi:hypothetical protein pb186bvf_018718 [Paramecium bursaria]
MRALLLLLLLGAAVSVDLSTSLLSMKLSDISLLDTSSMSCDTPQSEFARVSSQMSAWGDIVQHKESIPKDINTLQSLKKLIQKRNVQAIEEKLEQLVLPKLQSQVGAPILAEFKHQLKNLQDPEQSKQCEETLLKLCIYLIKQFNDCRRQCNTNPVTVIKIKGKIKDLQVVQQGCGCQPPCEEPTPPPFVPPPDEPTPPGERTPTPPVDVTTPPPGVKTPTPPGDKTPTPPPGTKTPTPPVDVTPPPGDKTPTPPPGNKTPTPPGEKTPTPLGEKTPTPPSGTKTPTPPGEKTPTPPPGEKTPTPPPGEKTPTPPPGEKTPTPPPGDKTPTPPGEESEPSEGEEEPSLPESEEPEPPGKDPTPNPDTESEEEPSESEEEEHIPPEYPPGIIIPPPDEPIIPERACQEIEDETIFIAHDSATPAQKSDLEYFPKYALGFYAKWLTKHPVQLFGRDATANYFVGGVYDDLGNKLITIELTQEGFEYSVWNGETETSHTFPVDDIESQWNYFFVTYDQSEAEATVYFNKETVTIPSEQGDAQKLHFVLGGKQGNVDSFQGAYYGFVKQADENAYYPTQELVQQFVLGCLEFIQPICAREYKQYENNQFFGADTPFTPADEFKDVFPQEYSVSGWFKWIPPTVRSSWHTAFRLTLFNADQNKNHQQLGDRDLALFYGDSTKDNILAFTTYNYTDQFGGGNPTLWQGIPQENDITAWHYIYFGYSRHINKAYAYAEFLDRAGEVHFPNTHHYDSPVRYLFVGGDPFYPSFSGKTFGLHINLCRGSYSEQEYDDPPFGYIPPPFDPPSEEEEVVPPPEVPPTEPLPPKEPTPPSEHPEEEEELPPPERPNPPPEEPSISEESEPEEPVPPPKSEPEEPEEPSVPEEEEPTPKIPEEPPIVPPPDEEPTPEPEPSPSPPPVEPPKEPSPPPEEPPKEKTPVVPQPPAPECPKTCPRVVDINRDNAADILCGVSHFLGEFAQGNTPASGPDVKRLCFCMNFNVDNAPPSLLQLQQLMPGHVRLNEPKIENPLLKKFIIQKHHK